MLAVCTVYDNKVYITIHTFNVDYNSSPIIKSRDVYGEEIHVSVLTKDQVDSYFEQLLQKAPQSLDDE